jgi:hypothetical protein
VRNLYSFAVRPSLAFYFQAPLEVSVSRILVGRPVLKYHEAGMDLGLSSDPIESFKLFQGIIKDEYDRMAKKEKLVVVDSSRPIHVVQKKVRAIIRKALEGYEAPRDSASPPGVRPCPEEIEDGEGVPEIDGRGRVMADEEEIAAYPTPHRDAAPLGSRRRAKRAGSARG